MDIEHLLSLLKKVRGCSFASMNYKTEPSPGIVKTVLGAKIILFSNSKGSGYEKMVKRRLKEMGRNPDNFVLGDLPWGVPVPDTPLLEHKGQTYLRCVILDEGEASYTINGIAVSGYKPGLPPGSLTRPKTTNQGLKGNEVQARTFKLPSILEMTLFNETV